MHYRKVFLSAVFLALTVLSLGACVTTQENSSFPEVGRTDAVALKEKGHTAFEAEKFDIALKSYTAALKLDEGDKESRYGLAESQLKLGMIDEALKNYNMMLPFPEYKPLALQGAGLAQLVKGDQLAAEESLSQAVQINDTLWRAWNGLAQIYDMQGMWDESDLAYSKALEYTSKEHVIYNNLGVSYMAQERFKDAERVFVEALRYKPNLKIAEINYKLALAMQNKYEEATIESNEIERAKSLNNAGYAAMLKGDYVHAERLFMKAIEVSPSFYKAAYNNLQVLHKINVKAKGSNS